MTNSELIRDAMGMLGVLRISQTPDADQSKQAMRVMNDMLFEWQSLGIDLQYSAQDNATDEIPFSEDAIEAVKSNLALRLSTYYGRTPPPAVVGMAQSSYARLVRDAVNDARYTQKTTHLPLGEANRLWGYNIVTDIV